MAKRIVRLTESDLVRLVKKVISEQRFIKHKDLDTWTNDDDLTNWKVLPGEHSDWDEEEYDDYDTFSQKYPNSKSHKHGWGGQDPKEVFGKYQKEYGNLQVKNKKSIGESEDDVEPQFADFGMEPIDNTRFDDEEYMTDWQNRFKDWIGSGKADEHRKHHGAWMDRQREKKKTKNNTQVTDLGMEPLDKTKFNDKDYMSDWENKFKDWTGKEKGKKSMGEQFDDMDDDESEPCIHCGGSGYDYDNDHDCEWCDGTGVHDELHIHKDDVYPKTKWSYSKNMDEQSKEDDDDGLFPDWNMKTLEGWEEEANTRKEFGTGKKPSFCLGSKAKLNTFTNKILHQEGKTGSDGAFKQLQKFIKMTDNPKKKRFYQRLRALFYECDYFDPKERIEK